MTARCRVLGDFHLHLPWRFFSSFVQSPHYMTINAGMASLSWAEGIFISSIKRKYAWLDTHCLQNSSDVIMILYYNGTIALVLYSKYSNWALDKLWVSMQEKKDQCFLKCYFKYFLCWNKAKWTFRLLWNIGSQMWNISWSQWQWWRIWISS